MRFSGYKNLVPPQTIAQCFINSLAGNGFTSPSTARRVFSAHAKRRGSKIIHHFALDIDFEGWQLRGRTILGKAALDHPRPDSD